MDVFQNLIPTVVSVRPEVTEKWMARFVVDLVESLSVSRTSTVAQTFGPAVSKEYSPVVFFWGGGGCRCIPPGVRRARPSCGVGPTRGSFRLRSVCPASCRFRISGRFWGKVAFDAVGLGVGPPCFQVDSEEALQKRTDERALLARAAPGATPEMKLVTRSWIVGEGEYTNGVKNIKYVPQLTASIWMPFEQSGDEESDDEDFDAAAPWNDGETRRDDRHEVCYRPGVHGEQAFGEESSDTDFDSFKMDKKGRNIWSVGPTNDT